MKIKRIKTLRVNAYNFAIKWDSSTNGGSFDFSDREILIGTKDNDASRMFMVICHELYEIAAIECHCRYNRPDVQDDYLFAFNHAQHDTIINIFSGLLEQFIQD